MCAIVRSVLMYIEQNYHMQPECMDLTILVEYLIPSLRLLDQDFQNI